MAMRPSAAAARSGQWSSHLQLADAQQAGQPGIGGAIGRIQQHGRAAGKIEAAADDQADAGFLGALVGADDAGKGVAVGDGDRLHAQDGGACDQFLDLRGAAQEAVVGGDLEFGVHPAIIVCSRLYS